MPAAAYVCCCVPLTLTSVVLSSPQSIVAVAPVWISTGMWITYGDVSTSQVVTNASFGGRALVTGPARRRIWTPSSFRNAATAA